MKELIYHFLACANVERAAIRAGIPFGDALEYLTKEKNQETIQQMAEILAGNLRSQIATMLLASLAAGTTGEVVTAIMGQTISNADAANVAEITKKANGDVTMRFFDKSAAVFKMAELYNTAGREGLATILDALGGAARNQDTASFGEPGETESGF